MSYGYLEAIGADGGSGLGDPWALAGGGVGNSNTQLDPTGRYGGSSGGNGGMAFNLDFLSQAGGGYGGGGGGVPNFGFDPNALNQLPVGNSNGSSSSSSNFVSPGTGTSASTIDWNKIMMGGDMSTLAPILRGIFTGSSASPTTPPFNPNAPGGQGGNGSSTATNSQGKNLEYYGALLKAISGAAPGLNNLYDSFQGLNQNDWSNAAKVNVLNWLRDQASGAQQSVGAINGAVTPAALNYANAGGASSQQQQQQVQQALQQLLSSAGGDFSKVLSANAIPGMSGAYDYLGGLLGQGSNSLGQLNSFGAPGNSNPMTQVAQQVGIGALLNGGYTPQLGKASSIAEGLTGGDPTTQLAQQRAGSILSKDPLLPMDQVLSLVQNQSATGAKNNYNTLKRQLMNTTGIGGPAIAGGGLNELLANAGDESLQAQSKALTDALLGQQELQLQQFGQGTSLYGAANSGDLNRTGLGLQSMLSADSAGLNRMNSLGQLGLGGTNADLSRILGSSGASTSLLNALGGITGNEMNSFQNAANFGLNQTSQSYGNQNQLIQSLLQNAGLGQQGFLQGMQIPNQTLQTLIQYMGQLGGNQTSLFGQSPVSFSYGFGGR